MLKMVDNILKTIIFLVLIFLTIFNFSDVNISIENTQYLTQYTYYYPGDATGSGGCTGSGKCIDSFTTDENGWYYYETNGEKYLVVAAALNICKNSTNHCGINVVKHGIAQNIKYYNYFDTLNLNINGKTYKAMVLDACGACMWGRQDERGQELFDIYVKNSTATIPNSNNDNSSYIGNDSPSVEHFGTYYEGDIKQGWIYQRFEFKEVYKKDIPEYKIESNINDVIDEIFNRAKTSLVSYYNGGLVFGITGETPSSSLDLKNRYWYNYDIDKYLGNTLFGQCVWYAKHRALEIIDSAGYDNETKQKLLASIEKTSGNGQDWYNNPDSSIFNKSTNINDAKPGAIVSWSKGQYGHVAIVESVYEKEGTTYVTISEGWRNGRTESGWTISNSVDDAWAHSTVRKVDLTLEQLKNKDGSFNGYVYLLNN